MKPTILALVAALALAAAPDARVKVRSDYDKRVDFTKLKVFAWPADGPGQVKMAVSANDDPDAVRKRLEPVLIPAVEQALAKKGFVKAAPGAAPDFLVAYFALVSVNTSAQHIGQFLPGTLEWGIPPFEGQTQSLKIFEQGSLVLDVWTPDKQPMWRAIAQAELHRDRPQAQREKNLRGVVNDIVKQFPPKKK
jgi:hypothetical protein